MSAFPTPRGAGRLGRAALFAAPALLAPFALAAWAGCGSSTSATMSAASIDGGQAPLEEGGSAAASDAGVVGAACSQANRSSCAGNVCLVFDDSGTGLCSAPCSSPGSTTGSNTGECGDHGTCIATAAIDGGACYRTCGAGSDCAAGIPCIWYASMDAGLCEPLPASLRGSLAFQGGCQACLGQQCWDSISACIEDVGCSQLESACAGNASCANMLEGSANAAAMALGACAVNRCAAACQ